MGGGYIRYQLLVWQQTNMLLKHHYCVCNPNICPLLDTTWNHVSAQTQCALHAKVIDITMASFSTDWSADRPLFPCSHHLCCPGGRKRAAHVITQRHQVSLDGFIMIIKRNRFVYPHGNNVSHSLTMTNEQHRVPHTTAQGFHPKLLGIFTPTQQVKC